MSKATVLVADDHRIFVDGLTRILEPEYEVLEPVTDGLSLVSAALQHKPDLLIVDVSMPKLNGIDAVRQILKDAPKAKVIMLTMHPDPAYARAAINMGVQGYVLKHEASQELLNAAEAVLDGGRFTSDALREEVEASLAEVSTGRRRSLEIELTARQREVLQLIAEGRTAKEIAALLHISPRTVEFHKQTLRKLLSVDSTAELVQHAIRIKLISVAS